MSEIILVIDQQGNMHLVDYFSYPSKRKYTLCEKVYDGKAIVNTLGIDNSAHGICRNCCQIYNKVYDDHTYEIMRDLKSNLSKSVVSEYFYNRAGTDINTATYKDLLSSKVWYKLENYRRKLKRR